MSLHLRILMRKEEMKATIDVVFTCMMNYQHKYVITHVYALLRYNLHIKVYTL